MEISKVPAGVLPNVKSICAEVVSEFGKDIPNVWGISKYPDHNTRRCVDYMCGKAAGDKIAQYHIANADRMQVVYIIWNRRIWRREGNSHGPARTWTPYYGDKPHTDHVHVEYESDGQAEKTIMINGKEYPDISSVSVFYINESRKNKTFSRHTYFLEGWLTELGYNSDGKNNGEWSDELQADLDAFRWDNRKALGIKTRADAGGSVGIYSLTLLRDKAGSPRKVREGK